MSTTTAAADRSSHVAVGPLLRRWRERRRFSQLDLASRAQVSTRHLSYVENGRSSPSRELVLHLAEHLDVPHRERNDLLLAAGFAPSHLALDLDDPTMSDVRTALDAILLGSGTHPTLVMDRHWNLIDANAAAIEWTAQLPDDLLSPPINIIRATLHPDGLAGAIDNLSEVRHHLVRRLERQIERTADQELATLLADITTPSTSSSMSSSTSIGRVTADAAAGPAMPVVMTIDGVTTRYLSVVSTFGSPLDITAAELTIETFYVVG